MDILDNEGYIFFNDFVDKELLYDMNNNFLEDDNINYKNYDTIIKKCLYILDHKLNWNSLSLKYRVSEGKNKKTSNSVDAAGFHRDIKRDGYL